MKLHKKDVILQKVSINFDEVSPTRSVLKFKRFLDKGLLLLLSFFKR